MIPQELRNDIEGYCKANSITDVDGFIIKLITRAFTQEKYGYSPALSIASVERHKTAEVLPIEPAVPVVPIVPVDEPTVFPPKPDLYDE